MDGTGATGGKIQECGWPHAILATCGGAIRSVLSAISFAVRMLVSVSAWMMFMGMVPVQS